MTQFDEESYILASAQDYFRRGQMTNLPAVRNKWCILKCILHVRIVYT